METYWVHPLPFKKTLQHSAPTVASPHPRSRLATVIYAVISHSFVNIHPRGLRGALLRFLVFALSYFHGFAKDSVQPAKFLLLLLLKISTIPREILET